MEKSERERAEMASIVRKSSFGSGSNGGSSQLDSISGGMIGTQRIKELHKVIAEHERTIRELKAQSEDNMDKINVNIPIIIIKTLICLIYSQFYFTITIARLIYIMFEIKQTNKMRVLIFYLIVANIYQIT